MASTLAAPTMLAGDCDPLLEPLQMLLESLHEPGTAPLSHAVMTTALSLCEELACHFRSLLDPPPVIGAAFAKPEKSVDVAPAGSESAPSDVPPPMPPIPPDDEAGAKGLPARSNRLSKKDRERLRRRQRRVQEAAEGQESQDGQEGQQTDDFRQSLWNQGWQMAPIPPSTPAVDPQAFLPAAQFVHCMWDGGWHMVAQPVAGPRWPNMMLAPTCWNAFQERMWSGQWHLVAPPLPPGGAVAETPQAPPRPQSAPPVSASRQRHGPRAAAFGDEPRREQGKHGQLRAGEQTLWC